MQHYYLLLNPIRDNKYSINVEWINVGKFYENMKLYPVNKWEKRVLEVKPM